MQMQRINITAKDIKIRPREGRKRYHIGTGKSGGRGFET
jgi:hypothetical protein